MKIVYVLTRIPSLDAKGDQLVYYYRIKSFLKLGYKIELVLLLLKNRINKRIYYRSLSKYNECAK